MIKCKLTLTEWFTSKQIVKAIMPKDPRVAAEIHSRNNPTCGVLLEYEKNNKPNVITLPPYNMVNDQLLVEESELSLNKFTTKWYGKVSKAKLKAIEKELLKEIADEFGEEEEPIEEEMIID